MKKTFIPVLLLTVMLTCGGCRAKRSVEHSHFTADSAATRQVELREVLKVDKRLILDSVTIKFETLRNDSCVARKIVMAKRITVNSQDSVTRSELYNDSVRIRKDEGHNNQVDLKPENLVTINLRTIAAWLAAAAIVAAIIVFIKKMRKVI